MARFAPPAVRSASGVNARNRFAVIRRTDCTIYSKRGAGRTAARSQCRADCAIVYRLVNRVTKSAGDFENLTTLFSLARHLNHKIMIAFIDLDNFKLINDRFGHNSGDLFLIQVGERLNTLQQNGEVIGRLGGDEFLVVSLNNENADISSLRERIQQQIRGEYHLGDVDLYYPGASLGIVEVDPETTDADSALHAADIAMYQEKKHKQKTPFVAHPALHS